MCVGRENFFTIFLFVGGEAHFIEADAEIFQSRITGITVSRFVPEVARDIVVPIPRHVVTVVDPDELGIGEVLFQHIGVGPKKASRLDTPGEVCPDVFHEGMLGADGLITRTEAG